MRNLWRSMRLLGACALVLAFSAFAGQPAQADGSVSSLGMGGGAPTAAEFKRFETAVQQYNASGERFRIDTHCQSACTMFLAIRNICIAPGASLAFHAGGSMRAGIISPEYTGRMMRTYNAALRGYLTRNHIMETFAFHTISGSDLVKRFGYRACP